MKSRVLIVDKVVPTFVESRTVLEVNKEYSYRSLQV